MITIQKSETTKSIYLKALSKYQNKVSFLEDMDEVVNGVRMHLAPGHSPGHSVVEFKHGETRVTVIGDLWHLRVRFEECEITEQYEIKLIFHSHKTNKMTNLCTDSGAPSYRPRNWNCVRYGQFEGAKISGEND